MTVEDAARDLSRDFSGCMVGFVPTVGEEEIVVYTPAAKAPKGLPATYQGFPVKVKLRVAAPRPL